MGKILTGLPAPLGADGQELSAEEIERLNSEPLYVPVELLRGDKVFTFFVAADFDNVGKAEDQAYQLIKADEYKILVDERRKRAASAEDDDAQLTGEQNRKLTELRPKQYQVFANLVLPAILGDNVPGMPDVVPDFEQSKRDLREWLESGNATSRAVLEALVMAYDPTGPLAQGKKMQATSQKLIEEIEAKVRAKMEQTLSGMDSETPDSPYETSNPNEAMTETATSSSTQATPTTAPLEG